MQWRHVALHGRCDAGGAGELGGFHSGAATHTLIKYDWDEPKKFDEV
jgi:hypothetical protein